VSYQAEERYWTDYVRVATPIVGLLLLLGVFWYWASSLIGDESSAPPPTTVAMVTVIPADTPTPTPTEEATNAPETPEATATQAPPPTRTPRAEPTATDAEPTEKPTEQSCSGRWCTGDSVLSADNNVNLRAEPSTDATVLEVLSLDQPLTILSSQPTKAGGYVWWNVRDEANDIEGWVVEDWLKDAA
jgi:hypothetical protein